MPSLPRSAVFNPLIVGIYHCWSRCVRRAFLCGRDPYTGKDYSHRKGWIRDGLKRLAGAFAVDVLDYAVLDNHLHVVLRNRPDVVALWSDEMVARKWWQACPDRTNKDGSPAEPTAAELRALQADPIKLLDLRTRLSDISWFMRLLTQPVARRANKEDEVTGRFFAERFGSEPIESLAQLLCCSMYVDLNLVRAGIALSPETSEFASIYDRIAGRLRRQKRDFQTLPDPSAEADADAWLAPIFLDERASAYQSPEQAAALSQPPPGKAFAPRASDKGFLPIQLDEYLELADWACRRLQAADPAAAALGVPPILERLQIDVDLWLDNLQHYQPRTRRPLTGPLAKRPSSACEQDALVPGDEASPPCGTSAAASDDPAAAEAGQRDQAASDDSPAKPDAAGE